MNTLARALHRREAMRRRKRWRGHLLLAASPLLFTACLPSVDLGDGSGPAAQCGSPVGSVATHRLSNVEYDNTVRDLLGDTSRPSSQFPVDDTGASTFTNNADALSISPLLFEAYETAAEALATTAMAGPARSKIMVCDPATAGEDACRSQIMSTFAARAWRRPLTTDEVTALVNVASASKSQGDPFETGIQIGVQAVLLSPNFLFRAEIDATPGDPTPHLLEDHELASRLSYFLWSSMPDDELRASADAGKLRDRNELDAQAKRMLADPRALSLVDNFGRQWLNRTFVNAKPDPMVFPAFTASLRASMNEETQQFLQEVLLGSGSLLDLIDGQYTYVNSELASYYGLPPVTGSGFQKVSLAGTNRGGILTQGSWLAQTSLTSRTIPTRRGAWVLALLLCQPPTTPPGVISALPPEMPGQTIRQRLAGHATAPGCANCHALMDPIGLSMEHFDAIGRWRDLDSGAMIDATGQLPSGVQYDGVTQLEAALKADPAVLQCATNKVLSFALGRVPTTDDTCRIQAFAADIATKGYQTKELLLDVIHDDSFRMRQGK